MTDKYEQRATTINSITAEELKQKFHRWIYKEILVDECQHEWGASCGMTGYCKHCGKCLNEDFNRTFDNWSDYGAVLKCLQEKQSAFFKYIYNFLDLQNITVDLFFTTLQEWWEKEIKK